MFREVTPHLLAAWPTLLLKERLGDFEAMNERLTAEVTERARSESGANNSNADSWQSRHADFFTQRDADRDRLLTTAIKLIGTMSRLYGVAVPDDGMSVEGWCVMNLKGNHHDYHIHSGSLWSGVYYVNVPSSQPSVEDGPGPGAIEFFDPRLGRPVDVHSTYQMQPEAGMMIAFPSWLAHWVRPHYESIERICIPFNAYLRVPEVKTWR